MHTEEEKKILMKIISKKNIYKKKKIFEVKMHTPDAWRLMAQFLAYPARNIYDAECATI